MSPKRLHVLVPMGRLQLGQVHRCFYSFVNLLNSTSDRAKARRAVGKFECTTVWLKILKLSTWFSLFGMYDGIRIVTGVPTYF